MANLIFINLFIHHSDLKSNYFNYLFGINPSFIIIHELILL